MVPRSCFSKAWQDLARILICQDLVIKMCTFLESRAQLYLPDRQVARETCLPCTRTHLPRASRQGFCHALGVPSAGSAFSQNTYTVTIQSLFISLERGTPPPRQRFRARATAAPRLLADFLLTPCGMVESLTAPPGCPENNGAKSWAIGLGH